MNKIKFIYFDVADTLLYKPLLYKKISETLENYSIIIKKGDIKKYHKMLREIITFPPRPAKNFYMDFNEKLMVTLGLKPEDKIAESIYRNCTALKWEAFDDIAALRGIKLPLGIITNWDTTLTEKLDSHIPIQFKPVIISSSVGISKPNPGIYSIACDMARCNPSEILYVGDSIYLDIMPAQTMGMRTLLIDRENLYPYFNGKKISSLYELTPLLNLDSLRAQAKEESTK